MVMRVLDVAQTAWTAGTRVRQMESDDQLLGMRRQGVVVPAEFFRGNIVVKRLSDTIIQMRDARRSSIGCLPQSIRFSANVNRSGRSVAPAAR